MEIGLQMEYRLALIKSGKRQVLITFRGSPTGGAMGQIELKLSVVGLVTWNNSILLVRTGYGQEPPRRERPALGVCAEIRGAGRTIGEGPPA